VPKLTTEQVHAQLKAEGVTGEQIDRLTVRSVKNWPAVLRWVCAEGPGIVDDFLTLFDEPPAE